MEVLLAILGFGLIIAIFAAIAESFERQPRETVIIKRH